MKLGRKPNKTRDGYVSTIELCQFLDCAKVTVSLMIKQGRLPKPEVFGKANFWRIELLPAIKKSIGE